jgi:endonuclease/exonuclease/phosphatase family metal-dependent hydrolase
MIFGAARTNHGVRRRLVGAATAGALAATLGLSTVAPALAEVEKPDRGTPSVEATPRTVDVMTRNLYLGSSLDEIIAALGSGSPIEILTAATRTWTTVQESDPAERMAAVADEIASARPAVIGLQEVTTWSTYAYDPVGKQTVGEPTVRYDFLELLLDALAEEGLTYHEVSKATSNNFLSPAIPVLTREGPTTAVQLADRDVILRRDDVKARNGQHGNFKTILSIPQPEPLEALPVDRGWGSADVTVKRTKFRFVNAHTEAWGPEALREAQVMELFKAQAQIAALSGILPTVYVGDYNSAAPDEGAYELLESVLDDAWVEAKAPGPGYTCCQAGDLSNTTSRLDERIDLVMTTRKIRATESYRTGTTTVDLPGETLWASDHAGVVARLLIK